MMLDMMLSATPSLSRLSPSSVTGGVQADQTNHSGADFFAQLLLQAGKDGLPAATPALETATLPLESAHLRLPGTELGDRQLLAQMIAENSGLTAPADAFPQAVIPAQLMENASGDAAELRESETLAVAELTDDVEFAAHAAALHQPVDNGRRAGALLPSAGNEAPPAQPGIQPVAAAGGQVELSRILNPSPPASLAPVAHPDALPVPVLDAATGQAAPEPVSAIAGPSGNSVNPLATVQGPQSPVVSAPVNTPAWSRELGQQVAIAVRADDQHISLRLNPANLGPLQIELKVLDQQAHLQFLSPHAQVRGAVEQAIPQLREALAEQGITLADTSVGEQRQQQQDSGSDRPAARGGHSIAQTQGDDAAFATAEPAHPLADGRINVYV